MINDRELLEASNALGDWFKSQSLGPAEAMLVAEMFIARMVVVNSTSSNNREEKFQLFSRTIRNFAAKLEEARNAR